MLSDNDKEYVLENDSEAGSSDNTSEEEEENDWALAKSRYLYKASTVAVNVFLASESIILCTTVKDVSNDD